MMRDQSIRLLFLKPLPAYFYANEPMTKNQSRLQLSKTALS